MPIEFWDDETERVHDQFQNWRARHAHAFFINVASAKSAMLHRATCPHPGDAEWRHDDHGAWGSLTRKRKVCSTDIQVLRRWAEQQLSSAALAACRDCRPE